MTGILINFFLFIILIPMIVFAQHERTDHWKIRVALFDREAENAVPGRIVFLGNSITEGFDLRKHFPDTTIINRGISGDHIDGLLARFDNSVTVWQPQKLFVLIGINDIGALDTEEQILTNYDKLLNVITDSLPDTRVYFNSILPTTPEWENCPKDKIVRINAELKQRCSDHGFTWINIHNEFVTPEGILNRALTSDGLHLNAAGYEKWTGILTPYVLEK